ncbi:MAG: hypothetical protein AB1571_02745 [Nanoarchaeota archaeon]
MNKIIVILDGVGDLPCKNLGGKTPLEAAFKPNLDFLAKNGKCGLMRTINKNIAPESDEAMISILGNDVFKSYTGRGILEALGSGKKIKKGCIVLRCNFVRVDGDAIKDTEAVVSDKIKKGMLNKLNKINLGIKHKLIYTVGHRAILVLEKGSDEISNTHPGYRIIRNYVTSAVLVSGAMKIKQCKALDKNAKETARAINKFVMESRKVTKGIAIVTRGASKNLPKLKKMKNWVLLADMPVEKAIGKISGMRIIKKEGYRKDALKVLKIAKKYNVYIQIKGPDSFGHKNRPIQKKKIIEKIDKEFFSIIRKAKAMVVVTGDHSTPCKLKAHSKHPIPVLIYGNGRDDVKKFSEKNCKTGELGLLRGRELIKIATSLQKNI